MKGIKYNNSKRNWTSINDNNNSFNTQMDAWLSVKEGMETLNEEYTFEEFPSEKDLELSTYLNRLKELVLTVESNLSNLLNKKSSYKEFYQPYTLEINKISEFIFPLNHLQTVSTSATIKKVYEESLPVLSMFYSKLGQNENIYNKIKESISNENDDLILKILNDDLKSFELSGVGLSNDKQERLKEIGVELSKLGSDFSENVINDTNNFTIVANIEDLEEMPEQLRNRNLNEKNEYEFTLHYPSYSAFMKYCSNSELREQMYKKYVTRAYNTNNIIIDKIISLKNEKAKLLGFNNYAELSIETKMVNDSNQVVSFLENLGNKSKTMAQLELKELSEYAKTDITPSNGSYYTTKLLNDKYKFNEEDFKPYFELNNTVNGLFSVLYKMFDLVFKVVETKTWDETVLVYDVYRHNMKISRIYLDLQNRPTKRPGAWMNDWKSRHLDENNNVVLPIGFVSCNFTPALKGKPSLLTTSDVVTLFHEMGHILQHICYEGNDLAVSGLNTVEWDAVEWSSQFLESFVYNENVLSMISKHYKTNESLPSELIDKLIENKNFQNAWSLSVQTVYSLFDMNIYSKDNVNVKEELKLIRDKYSVMEIPDYNSFETSFSHIFSGGYSAGYYSYKWSEVLSSDCYMKFKKEGVFNKELCDKYYNSFLNKGSEYSSMKMFENFMDRKPNEDGLLEYLGIK